MKRIFRIAVLGQVHFEHASAMFTGIKGTRCRAPMEIIPLHYSQNAALNRLIQRNRIDGIIGDLLSDRWVESLQTDGRRLALVHIGGQSVLHSVSTVSIDDYRIGALAASHYLQRHYRHLYFAGLAGDAAARQKLAGFSETAAAAGHGVTELPTLSLTAPLTVWENFMRTLPSPAAVFCQDDGVARRVIACCRHTATAVPDAVSIIGTGNISLDSLLAGIGISSIEADYTALGAEAARLMEIALSDPEAPPTHIRLPPRGLILRESTGIGGGNSLVGRALDFMEKQLAAPIRVDDIAAHVNASRRLLELRFRETLGRSPHEELTRLRMARARERLTDPHISVAAIAEECGYPERAHFDARFKQHHNGTPPAAWRAAAGGTRLPDIGARRTPPSPKT